ncbi:MAG: ATP-binding protein [Pseudomonadota bacterium]
MGNPPSLPFVGILLALVTFVALLLGGVDTFLAISMLIVWIGSLVLASARPPEPANVVVQKSLSQDAMRGLIENSATPLLVTDRNKIALANRAARRMLGQHIIGQDARMAFRQPSAISLITKERNGRAIVRGLVRRRDIWQINRQSVDDSMAVIELINKTSEADISRAHTDFVANASHELRTPLAGIIGYVETLSEDADSLDTPTAKKFLDTIQREAQRMQHLVSDLMSLSRVEAEKHDSPSEMLDLAPVVERAARDVAGSRRVDQLQFKQLDKSMIRGDAQQLEQLVRNLVDNALKYGAHNKPVMVELDRSQDGQQARLTVANEGEGIEPEHLPHLTRRFYRTDPGRSRASGGTGLGLAIVKHIVERHRGRLDIHSDLGQGTQVIVRIPLESPDATDEQEEKNSAIQKVGRQDENNVEASQAPGGTTKQSESKHDAVDTRSTTNGSS